MCVQNYDEDEQHVGSIKNGHIRRSGTQSMCVQNYDEVEQQVGSNKNSHIKQSGIQPICAQNYNEQVEQQVGSNKLWLKDRLAHNSCVSKIITMSNTGKVRCSTDRANRATLRNSGDSKPVIENRWVSRQTRYQLNQQRFICSNKKSHI